MAFWRWRCILQCSEWPTLPTDLSPHKENATNQGVGRFWLPTLISTSRVKRYQQILERVFSSVMRFVDTWAQKSTRAAERIPLLQTFAAFSLRLVTQSRPIQVAVRMVKGIWGCSAIVYLGYFEFSIVELIFQKSAPIWRLRGHNCLIEEKCGPNKPLSPNPPDIPSAGRFSPTVIDKSQPIESMGSRLRDHTCIFNSGVRARSNSRRTLP